MMMKNYGRKTYKYEKLHHLFCDLLFEKIDI